MPDSDVDLGAAVRLAPREAITYFRAKGYRVSWNWFEVWQAAHARAFTVAKATRLEVLDTIRDEVDRALTQGLTERAFAQALTPRLQRLGWWGKPVVVDAAGGAEVVQLGSPHRLRTIYRTNLQTAYMAAREKAQRENTEHRPYWQYVAINDDRTRATHRALNNAVFRADDPIWETHYPPNGWNCRCRVRALTERQTEQHGLHVESSGGRLREVDQIAGVNKRTGEEVHLPGTALRVRDPETGRWIDFAPEAGWSYNPGRAAARWEARAFNDEDIGGLKVDQPTFREWGLPPLRETPPALIAPDPGELPKVSTAAGAWATLREALGVPEGGHRVIETPAGLDEVVVFDSHLAHVVQKRGEARERYAPYLLATLEDPLEVWLTRYDDGGYRRRFIALFEGERQGLVIARENKDGSLFWNFLPTARRSINYVDRQRAGELLLYRKRGSQ